MPYVNHRWLGGLLTNWRTISARIDRLHELRRLKRGGPARPAAAEGANLDARRAGAPREPSRRRRRHEAPAGRDARRRPAQGGDRGAGGETPRPAGRRARRHELRPGRGRLRRPGQRRRDQVVRPRDPHDRGRDRGREAEGQARGVPGASACRARGRGRGRCRRGSARGAARRRGGSGAEEPAPAEEAPAVEEPAPAEEAPAVEESPLRPPRKPLPRRRCRPNDPGHGRHGQGAARDDGRADDGHQARARGRRRRPRGREAAPARAGHGLGRQARRATRRPKASS